MILRRVRNWVTPRFRATPRTSAAASSSLRQYDSMADDHDDPLFLQDRIGKGDNPANTTTTTTNNNKAAGTAPQHHRRHEQQQQHEERTEQTALDESRTSRRDVPSGPLQDMSHQANNEKDPFGQLFFVSNEDEHILMSTPEKRAGRIPAGTGTRTVNHNNNSGHHHDISFRNKNLDIEVNNENNQRWQQQQQQQQQNNVVVVEDCLDATSDFVFQKSSSPSSVIVSTSRMISLDEESLTDLSQDSLSVSSDSTRRDLVYRPQETRYQDLVYLCPADESQPRKRRDVDSCDLSAQDILFCPSSSSASEGEDDNKQEHKQSDDDDDDYHHADDEDSDSDYFPSSHLDLSSDDDTESSYGMPAKASSDDEWFPERGRVGSLGSFGLDALEDNLTQDESSLRSQQQQTKQQEEEEGPPPPHGNGYYHNYNYNMMTTTRNERELQSNIFDQQLQVGLLLPSSAGHGRSGTMNLFEENENMLWM